MLEIKKEIINIGDSVRHTKDNFVGRVVGRYQNKYIISDGIKTLTYSIQSLVCICWSQEDLDEAKENAKKLRKRLLDLET